MAARDNLAIDRAARDVGRDPREIRGRTHEGAHRSCHRRRPGGGRAARAPGEVLTHFAVDLGFSTLIPATESDPRTLTTFIENVAGTGL